MAKNCVISGDYKSYKVDTGLFKTVMLIFGFKSVDINRNTVENYEVLDEETKTSSASAVMRGGLGVALLGPIGGLAALGAKKKGTHMVAIEFKDGKRSLLEVDDKIYKALITALF